MFAKEPPCNGEHLLPHLAGEILCRLAVGVEVVGSGDVAAEMSLLVFQRVEELRRTAGEGNDHHRRPPPVVRIRETRIQTTSRQVAASLRQVRATATDKAEVAHNTLHPISGSGIIDAHMPVIAFEVYVLTYHSISSHITGVPLPIQSA